MDLRDYLRVIRASWALLLLGLLLGGGVAAGLTALGTPQYTVTSRLFVSTTGSPDLATAVQGNYYASDKVASYAELMTSKDLAAAVVDELGLGIGPADLAEKIEADVVQDTTILTVAVTDPSPQAALEVGQVLNEEFAELVSRLETPPGTSKSPVQVTVVASPELPQSPSTPTLPQTTALGALLGLVAAGVLALVRDRLDTTVKDDATAVRVAGAPVIGHVPADGELAGTHVLEPHSASPAAEAVRLVRTNLGFLDVDHPPRIIMVTSSLPQEGKTTLAVNLAMALAESGNKVGLVEADLRRPKVTSYLGMVGGVGLTNILRGDASLGDVTQDLFDGRLRVLPSGPVPPNPSELLASQAMASTMEQMLLDRDIVIIDAPPVLPVADASSMVRLADGVLVCARWGTVTTEQLERTAATFERRGAKVLGVVMTIVPARQVQGTYGYGYAAEEAPRESRSLLRRLFGRRSARHVGAGRILAVQPRTAAPPVAR